MICAWFQAPLGDTPNEMGTPKQISMTDTQSGSLSGPSSTATTTVRNIENKENVNRSPSSALSNSERSNALSGRNTSRARSPFKVRGRRPSKDCDPMPVINE